MIKTDIHFGESRLSISTQLTLLRRQIGRYTNDFIQLVELTPEIAIESTQLPGEFHRDPADQIIVATARILKNELEPQTITEALFAL